MMVPHCMIPMEVLRSLQDDPLLLTKTKESLDVLQQSLAQLRIAAERDE